LFVRFFCFFVNLFFSFDADKRKKKRKKKLKTMHSIQKKNVKNK